MGQGSFITFLDILDVIFFITCIIKIYMYIYLLEQNACKKVSAHLVRQVVWAFEGLGGGGNCPPQEEFWPPPKDSLGGALFGPKNGHTRWLHSN